MSGPVLQMLRYPEETVVDWRNALVDALLDVNCNIDQVLIEFERLCLDPVYTP